MCGYWSGCKSDLLALNISRGRGSGNNITEIINILKVINILTDIFQKIYQIIIEHYGSYYRNSVLKYNEYFFVVQIKLTITDAI